MLASIPRASLRLILLSKGLSIAATAASRARFSPEPVPVLMIAWPISVITDLTSAKSTLIKPLVVISSAMLCTALVTTSFAAANASSSVTSGPRKVSRFSFGTTIIESALSRSSKRPVSAIRILLSPSNENGSVTTATVNTPSSRAIFAIVGAAPVPVPPPMPEVINSISALPIAAAISSRLSSAACLPMAGSAPAPRPLVRFAPSLRMLSDGNLASAWVSVFMHLNVTPGISAEIICCNALQPPPPTPNTLMTAAWS